ncbi:hypothetical protein [Rhizobium leguminosarum]|uniref:Transmembrane protein n=1 Tax=Rhizobium leguminosarum TaxID=384 RepID=A0A2K9ZGK5_RHILE|nr:hypothetical protein [Rhizobium leguminosarum]AUW47171.1 hypothetical protein CUJ84_pRLN3000030 [Rhizobium leguminosarum]
MFEPELFGIAASRYADFGMSLITPLLGFLFLYFLRLPLKKLPFIGGDVNYTPPSWVLPLFAMSTLFALGLSFSIAFFLMQMRGEPNQVDFANSFERKIDYAPNIGTVIGASYSLVEYDGDSDVRIFLNGYRLFGTSSHCMLNFQCRNAADLGAKARFSAARTFDLPDLSYKHVRQLRSLPISEDVTDYLVPGQNIFDLFFGNSGVGDCAVQALIHLRGDKTERDLRLTVTDGLSAKPVEQTTGPGFDAYVYSASADQNSPESVSKYGTYIDNPSFRVCERIRVIFQVSNGFPFDEATWKAKQQARQKAENCEINPRMQGC